MARDAPGQDPLEEAVPVASRRDDVGPDLLRDLKNPLGQPAGV